MPPPTADYAMRFWLYYDCDAADQLGQHPAGNLVLQGKQIADVAVEPLRLQVRIGLGVTTTDRRGRDRPDPPRQRKQRTRAVARRRPPHQQRIARPAYLPARDAGPLTPTLSPRAGWGTLTPQPQSVMRALGTPKYWSRAHHLRNGSASGLTRASINVFQNKTSPASVAAACRSRTRLMNFFSSVKYRIASLLTWGAPRETRSAVAPKPSECDHVMRKASIARCETNSSFASSLFALARTSLIPFGERRTQSYRIVTSLR